MKLTFGLFLLELKRTLKFMPRILLCAAALFIIAALVLRFGGSEPDADAAKVKIGYYNPGDDTYISMLVNMVSEMDSVKSICVLEAADSEQSVYDGISSGKYYGGIVFPENYIQGIMDGSNTPARVIVPQGSNNSVFRRLVSVGSDMLVSVQAGIYAAAEGKHLSRTQLLDINMEYVNFCMGRSKLFVSENWSPYGALSLKQYYCAALLALFCMLIGAGLSFMFYDYGHGFKSYCKLWQYNGVLMLLLKQIVVTLIIAVFTIPALMLINDFQPFVEYKYVNIAAAVFICGQLITCFYTVFGGSAVLILTAFTLVTGFFAGCFVPTVYLSGAGLDKISSFMPVYTVFQCFSSLFTYHSAKTAFVPMIIGIYAVTLVLSLIKKGVRQ